MTFKWSQAGQNLQVPQDPTGSQSRPAARGQDLCPRPTQRAAQTLRKPPTQPARGFKRKAARYIAPPSAESRRRHPLLCWAGLILPTCPVLGQWLCSESFPTQLNPLSPPGITEARALDSSCPQDSHPCALALTPRTINGARVRLSADSGRKHSLSCTWFAWGHLLEMKAQVLWGRTLLCGP